MLLARLSVRLRFRQGGLEDPVVVSYCVDVMLPRRVIAKKSWFDFFADEFEGLNNVLFDHAG